MRGALDGFSRATFCRLCPNLGGGHPLQLCWWVETPPPPPGTYPSQHPCSHVCARVPVVGTPVSPRHPLADVVPSGEGRLGSAPPPHLAGLMGEGPSYSPGAYPPWAAGPAGYYNPGMFMYPPAWMAPPSMMGPAGWPYGAWRGGSASRVGHKSFAEAFALGSFFSPQKRPQPLLRGTTTPCPRYPACLRGSSRAMA